MGADPGRQPAGAAPGHLLDEHRIGDRIVTSAVLLGELQADVAEFGEAVEHLVGKPSRVLPLRRPRRQLGLHEAAHHLAKLLVLFGERWDRAARRAAGRSRLGREIGHGRNRTAANYQDMRGM